MIGSENKAKDLLIYVILVGVIIIVIFSYFYWSGSPELTSKMGGYIQILTLAILYMTGIITLMSYQSQIADRNRIHGLQYANLAQSEMIEIDKLFFNNPLLDRLYFQMYAKDPHIQYIMQMNVEIPETVERLKAEHQMASIIFQKIADVYACENLDTDDGEEWVNTFRAWMQSPILRSHWSYQKFEYHPEVRKLIDGLIR